MSRRKKTKMMLFQKPAYEKALQVYGEEAKA